MHALIANLLAGLLLIHALLGCCWHDGRTWTACVAPRCGVVIVGICSGSHGTVEHETGDQNRQHHPRPSPVEKCPCVYTFLPPGKTHARPLLVQAPFDLGAIYLLPVEVSADGLTRTCNRVAGPLEAQPSVRLHLLHQILLI